jgi:hypothetical protein
VTMVESTQAFTSALPPLTARRTLIVVALALVAAAVIVFVVITIATTIALAEHAASPGGFAGLEVVFFGVVVAAFTSFGVAVTTVAVGVRGRARSKTFTGLYTGVLLVTVLITALSRNLPHFPVSPSDSGLSETIPWLVLAPLTWTIPAAAVHLLRWRRVAIIAGIGLVLAILATAALAFKAQIDEQARPAALVSSGFARTK